ncbi:MAG: hypothetical protein SH850_13985 [Planctomycetaceae bacterium]|nr:hypothetical protein [Planctomycetaceae bacterium]
MSQQFLAMREQSLRLAFEGGLIESRTRRPASGLENFLDLRRLLVEPIACELLQSKFADFFRTGGRLPPETRHVGQLVILLPQH